MTLKQINPVKFKKIWIWSENWVSIFKIILKFKKSLNYLVPYFFPMNIVITKHKIILGHSLSLSKQYSRPEKLFRIFGRLWAKFWPFQRHFGPFSAEPPLVGTQNLNQKMHNDNNNNITIFHFIGVHYSSFTSFGGFGDSMYLTLDCLVFTTGLGLNQCMYLSQFSAFLAKFMHNFILLDSRDSRLVNSSVFS